MSQSTEETQCLVSTPGVVTESNIAETKAAVKLTESENDKCKETESVVKENDKSKENESVTKENESVTKENESKSVGGVVPPSEDTGAKGGNEEEEEVEEVIIKDWRAPIVEVSEVPVVTGEEEETVFWKHRSKLYRWAKNGSGGEWKERGLGEAKLLQHNKTNKIRFLLRQEKTLKIVANHYVLRHDNFCNPVPNSGSAKIWVWSVNDFADDVLQQEQFGLKFGQTEQANLFKEKFDEAAKINASLFDGIPQSKYEAKPEP